MLSYPLERTYSQHATHSVPSLILKEDLLKSVKRITFKTMLVTQTDEDSMHIHVFYQLPVNLYSSVLLALLENIQ